MSLLDDLATIGGHMNEALYHFNQARSMSDGGRSSIDIAHTLFLGLNKLQTEWKLNQQKELKEVAAFKEMIRYGLSPEEKSSFLQSVEIKNLIELNPRIMNHDTLRHGSYRPGETIDQRLAKKAMTMHHKVNNAYRDYNGKYNGNCEQLIKHIAELLYIVRSNIAHGEKTPYGPDSEKRKRDEQVCICIVPLQELLVDLLLNRPSKKLISYGTLAPGQPSHSVISDLKGSWTKCCIRGTMDQKDGLSRFSWDPAGSKHSADFLSSDDLPGNWCLIDRFEGAEYQRQLISAVMLPRIPIIANAYISQPKSDPI